jgi:hypothetical protein
VDAFADLGLGALPNRKTERDVVPDGHVLERRVVLEDHADAACAGWTTRDVLVADQHLARLRLLEPGNDAQERRLAAAAGAEEGGQRALGDSYRNVIEGGVVPEALGHVDSGDAH